MTTEPSAQPVPSITLQITKKDAERFLEATEMLKLSVKGLQEQNGVKSEASESNSTDDAKPLHEGLYEAVQQCEHPLVTQFSQRIKSFIGPSDVKQVKGATLLFSDSDKTAKLRQLFTLLATNTTTQEEEKEPLLDRKAAIALFRTVLLSISSCLSSTTMDSNSDNVIVEGRPSGSSTKEGGSSPARKKIKLEDNTASTKPETEDGGGLGQSTSWDSSLATLKDEDDKDSSATLRREVEDIATYAADELIKYAAKAKGSPSDKKKDDEVLVDLKTFGDWYNEKGSSIVPWIELLQLSKWKMNSAKKDAAASDSPGSLVHEEADARTLVSFDFTGSGCPTPLLINISEDNLLALRDLVHRTTIAQRPAGEVCKTLLRAATRRNVKGQEVLVLSRSDFQKELRTIIPGQVFDHMTDEQRNYYDESFLEFFSCFEGRKYLEAGEVDLMEFAVAFCFFCAGNKSTKLATGFELIDSKRLGYLTEDQLSHYLQSYLTVLVGMSLLTPMSKQKAPRPLTPEKRKAMRSAVESGAKWTLGHFLKASGQTRNEYTFESFASWYSSGGYNVAPWLELLDLGKVLSLIADNRGAEELPPLNSSGAFQMAQQKPKYARVSSLRRHHAGRRDPSPEVLFTFPLANRRSLIVLREDAEYVRGVVEQLGLLSKQPGELWIALLQSVERRRNRPVAQELAVYVNRETFVLSMQDICSNDTRKRPAPGSSVHNGSANGEILSNFFQCFDVDQRDSVALDELMGGLMLLCGGKKSAKLAFAFTIFDTRPGIHQHAKKVPHSLSGEDLFLFLRSVLIVTFATCRQSLDMTDDMVGRFITDTANRLCNDVMKHQWETKHMDRINFDEFGQWYNDGGFERAPWLELLDLNKWVLIDNFDKVEKHMAPAPPPEMPLPVDPTIPPPPPEDALDTSFFDENAIMQIDSMDEMDMILMQPSTDAEDGIPRISKSFSYGQSPRQQRLPPSPHHRSPKRSPPRRGNPLKFHLVTKEKHGGYMLSLSQSRIRHFRRLLEISGLCHLEAETACNEILGKSRSKLSKADFLTAMQTLMNRNKPKLDVAAERALTDMLSGIYAAFDRDGKGQASAIEVACGFTVLCRGKKSDKLEFAFEVLDKNKKGRLSRTDMTSYLQSFLTVLLSVAFSPALESDASDDSVGTLKGAPLERSNTTLHKAVKGGAEWASSLAFKDFDKSKKKGSAMSFDDFAEWYTSVGFGSIPWLELLDLQKWALTAETK